MLKLIERLITHLIKISLMSVNVRISLTFSFFELTEPACSMNSRTRSSVSLFCRTMPAASDDAFLE